MLLRIHRHPIPPPGIGSDHAAPVVVGVGDDDFGVARHDHAVLVVPGVREASVACHVAVGGVGEPLRRLRDEDAAGNGILHPAVDEDDLADVFATLEDALGCFGLFHREGGVNDGADRAGGKFRPEFLL